MVTDSDYFSPGYNNTCIEIRHTASTILIEIKDQPNDPKGIPSFRLDSIKMQEV